jgi:hypothetical protein
MDFERLVLTWLLYPIGAFIIWGLAYPFYLLTRKLPPGRLKRFLLWTPRERRHLRRTE